MMSLNMSKKSSVQTFLRKNTNNIQYMKDSSLLKEAAKLFLSVYSGCSAVSGNLSFRFENSLGFFSLLLNLVYASDVLHVCLKRAIQSIWTYSMWFLEHVASLSCDLCSGFMQAPLLACLSDLMTWVIKSLRSLLVFSLN